MPGCWVPGCQTTDVRPFISGPACAKHTPAATAGRPEVKPDPSLSVVALRDQMLMAARDSREAAIGYAVAYDPDRSLLALRIVRQWAESHPFVSANDVRARMDVASIPGQLRGPAFARAIKAGFIEPVSLETSTDPGTHAKPVTTYRSLIEGTQPA